MNRGYITMIPNQNSNPPLGGRPQKFAEQGVLGRIWSLNFFTEIGYVLTLALIDHKTVSSEWWLFVHRKFSQHGPKNGKTRVGCNGTMIMLHHVQQQEWWSFLSVKCLNCCLIQPIRLIWHQVTFFLFCFHKSKVGQRNSAGVWRGNLQYAKKSRFLIIWQVVWKDVYCISL